jgi:hypothetical protein
MLGKCNNFSQFCWNFFIYFIIILHLKFHAKNYKLPHFKNIILIFHTLVTSIYFFENSPNIIYVHHLLKTWLCQVSSFSNPIYKFTLSSLSVTRRFAAELAASLQELFTHSNCRCSLSPRTVSAQQLPLSMLPLTRFLFFTLVTKFLFARCIGSSDAFW